ncbi:MAG: ATP-binding cassette domain-containing protein [Cyanobacteria bacterium NC_groundwater_1444_Ag_S-0.65um_54_12]|nr:ATP-binding cassette domain-containing protein [Cyanobacteria bacterium NC_groundwater_1444_Ag_S-0.65um_54_12]
MPVIVANGLVRNFGTIEAVKGISFAIASGEIFGFVGPNGAGKSTTINILCTLLRPTAGQVMVNGCDVQRDSNAVRRSIGLVFQDTTLDSYLTAEQNLLFHGWAYGVPSATLSRRMRELLELVELWDRRKEKISHYSGGMKRRLEIARGLLHTPRVLFLDEPTLGLDPQTRRHIWNYVRELREREGLTIFMTTHYLDEAEICDRIAIIDHGKLVTLDTPDRLKDALGGDVVTLETEDAPGAAAIVRERYGFDPVITAGQVQFRVPNGERFLPEFVRSFDQPLRAISVRRPTLEDVFISQTGHAIRPAADGVQDAWRARWKR